MAYIDPPAGSGLFFGPVVSKPGVYHPWVLFIWVHIERVVSACLHSISGAVCFQSECNQPYHPNTICLPITWCPWWHTFSRVHQLISLVGMCHKWTKQQLYQSSPRIQTKQTKHGWECPYSIGWWKKYIFSAEEYNWVSIIRVVLWDVFIFLRHYAYATSVYLLYRIFREWVMTRISTWECEQE